MGKSILKYFSNIYGMVDDVSPSSAAPSSVAPAAQSSVPDLIPFVSHQATSSTCSAKVNSNTMVDSPSGSASISNSLVSSAETAAQSTVRSNDCPSGSVEVGSDSPGMTVETVVVDLEDTDDDDYALEINALVDNALLDESDED